MEINISVSKKVAFAERGTIVVCGNGDYVAKFTFDEVWAKYETKTARFKWGGKYTDVVFSGDECAMPIINNTCIAEVGVYAGDLHTTTPALIRCKRSILCGNEPESPASQEVKNEFLGVLDKRTGDLSALQTDVKDNLVSAINEAAASGGSADAILYTPQILTDDQKKTARANVEALSDNNVYYTYIPNDHSNDIYKLALSGPIGFIRGTWAAGMTPPITVIFGAVERGLVEAFAIGSNGNMCTTTLNLSGMPKPVWAKIKQLRLNDDDTLSQQTMASAPTADMQIATKKYVDDHEPKSLGITSAKVGQIVKIAAVNASGVPTAWSPVDMPSGGGGDFAWEKIAEINVADDVANGVSAWEYTGLPGYDAIMYFKQSLKGESSVVSGMAVAVNGGNSQPSGIQYSQGGYSRVGLIYLSPFGMLHLATGNANSPTNFSNGGMSTMYCPIPTDGDHITSIKLTPHTMYKVVSGKLTLYGGKHQ